MAQQLQNNLTLAILRKAEREGYGILAQVCYDAQSAIALVRAAERAQSPAMLLLFPVTLMYGGGPFLRFCLDLAHQATVPIAVHLDHATDPEHIEFALDLAEKGIVFDSIMVDASHADTDEENISISKPYVERAHGYGIAVEVELGRMEGGEAGLRTISDAKLTDPTKAEVYMTGTGADILAPSIGNLHGHYINPPNFRQDILIQMQQLFRNKKHLCLHGTDDLPEELFIECIKNGVSKINVNSVARNPYMETLSQALLSKPFPDVIEEATEVFACYSKLFMWFTHITSYYVTSALKTDKVMTFEVVLITGAAGFLGELLARSLAEESRDGSLRLILVDVVKPRIPEGVQGLSIVADLTDSLQVDKLFNGEFGVPDAIYCQHGVMSRGSEDNFDLALKVNVDSVRQLLLSARQYKKERPIKFIFTSSLAVYGGPLPDVIVPSIAAMPESTYGFSKLTSELFINEFTRRGFVDGRILRLPTVVVRPGAPSAATSSFMSGIIREPLKGTESICPIGAGLNSPELDLPIWIASPETTVKNLVHTRRISSERFLPHTRMVCLPGITVTVRDELQALEKVGGKKALDLVKFRDDPINRRVVSSWPSKFDNSYALSLGYCVDEGGIEAIVAEFKKKLEAKTI
ncbi:hypothetical protein AX17_005370 [Amanita inopinata Kibby_2008]|nr:hypothetical protein AX17_005370 [Amanita inopinata Kibby_2008]